MILGGSVSGIGVEARERSMGVVVREAMECKGGSKGSVEISILAIPSPAGF